MKTLISLSMLTLSFSAFSSTYKCDDNGVLKLTSSKSNPKLIFASLEYADGSASTLSLMELKGQNKGDLLRDDEEAYMGKFTISKDGKTVALKFDGEGVTTCTKK